MTQKDLLPEHVEETRCRWCQGVIEQRHGRGRPREFCSQSCRQWHWVAKHREQAELVLAVDAARRAVQHARAQLKEHHRDEDPRVAALQSLISATEHLITVSEPS